MTAKGATRSNVDSAGGTIRDGASKVFVEGSPVALDGAPVDDHGNDEHDSATMVATSTKVSVEGSKPVRADDSATCGDTATGSSKVFFG